MPRSLALLLVPAALSAAPLPPSPEPLYFPTRVGARWVYQYRTAGGEAYPDRVEVVTAVEARRGATRVKVGSETGGQMLNQRWFEVSPTGLSLVGSLGGDLTSPLLLLRLPHAAGNKWAPVLAGEQWGRAVGSATADGPEAVTVPAGTFRAIRVRLELPYIDGRRGKARSTTWYAPGVGVVKNETDEKVEVLKAFTHGTD